MTRSQVLALGVLVGLVAANLSDRIVLAAGLALALWAAAGVAEQVDGFARRRRNDVTS